MVDGWAPAALSLRFGAILRGTPRHSWLRSLHRSRLLVEFSQTEDHAIVGRVFGGTINRPAPCLVELVAVAFPFAPNISAALGDEPTKRWMIVVIFKRLLEGVIDREGKEWMTSRNLVAIKEDFAGVLGGEDVQGIIKRPATALQPEVQAKTPVEVKVAKGRAGHRAAFRIAASRLTETYGFSGSENGQRYAARSLRPRGATLPAGLSL